jgi:redox-sensitive bicupin YhaK (pirin superfamily)
MTCGGRGGIGAEPVRELLAGREVTIGESTWVRRLLPNLRRRMVGAWCFVDHHGPDNIAAGPRYEGAAPSAHRAADGQLAPGR